MKTDGKLIAMRDALGQALVEFGSKIPELVVLDADVSSSTKTAGFGKAYPERFFNVGVAEANMADIAAGMATAGLRPVINTFSLFLALKCADQIRNTICYNNLPVVLAGAYGGLSDSYDGASHQAILDVAMMRALPNMVVIVPADAVEMTQALELALRRNGPTFIRGCRNETPVLFEGAEPLVIGKARKLRDGKDVTIVACGVPVVMAMEAAEQLAKYGIAVDLLAVATVKPIDAETLAASASKTEAVLVVEEHNIIGGLGGAVAEALGKHAPAKMDYIGIQDRFTESGEYNALMKKYGISVEAIVEKAKVLVAAKPAAKAPAAMPAVAVKSVAKKAVVKKAVKKEAAAKKTAAKKPVAKKVVRKKPAAKKVVAKKPARKKR